MVRSAPPPEQATKPRAPAAKATLRKGEVTSLGSPKKCSASTAFCRGVHLRPPLDELHRLLLHAELERGFLADPVGGGVVPHVLADAHGAELGPTHGAEVGRL